MFFRCVSDVPCESNKALPSTSKKKPFSGTDFFKEEGILEMENLRKREKEREREMDAELFPPEDFV